MTKRKTLVARPKKSKTKKPAEPIEEGPDLLAPPDDGGGEGEADKIVGRAIEAAAEVVDLGEARETARQPGERMDTMHPIKICTMSLDIDVIKDMDRLLRRLKTRARGRPLPSRADLFSEALAIFLEALEGGEAGNEAQQSRAAVWLRYARTRHEDSRARKGKYYDSNDPGERPVRSVTARLPVALLERVTEWETQWEREWDEDYRMRRDRGEEVWDEKPNIPGISDLMVAACSGLLMDLAEENGWGQQWVRRAWERAAAMKSRKHVRGRDD